MYQKGSANRFARFRIHKVGEPEPQARPALRGVMTGSAPPIAEWKPYTQPLPGHFYVPHGSIASLRKQFLEQGQCPRTTMRSIFDIKKIIVRCTGEKGPRSGSCHIHELPRYYELLRRWVDALGEERLKLYGEGMGYLTLAAIEILMRPKRCLLYTSPSPRDKRQSRMPSSA